MWHSNLLLWKVILNPEQLLRVLFCSTSSSSHLHGKCRSFFFCLRQCENGFSNLLCLGHGLLSVSFLSLDSSTYFVIKGWFFWWNTILLKISCPPNLCSMSLLAKDVMSNKKFPHNSNLENSIEIDDWIQYKTWSHVAINTSLQVWRKNSSLPLKSYPLFKEPFAINASMTLERNNH